MSAVAWTTVKNTIAQWMIKGSGLPASRIRWGGQNAPQPAGSSQAWITLRIKKIESPGWDYTKFTDNFVTFADKTITLDPATDTAASVAHTFNTGDGPVYLTGDLTGTNVANSTEYWAIRVDDDTVKFATSFLDAINGVALDIQGTGTGPHGITPTPTTKLVGQEINEVAYGMRKVTVQVTCFPPQPTDDSTEAVAILEDVVAYSNLTKQYDAFVAGGVGMSEYGDPEGVDGVLNAIYFEPRATMTISFFTTSVITDTHNEIDYVEADNTPDTPAIEIDVSKP